MRQILTDHFRRSNASKRGGAWKKLTLTGIALADDRQSLDLGDLEDALEELEHLDPRQVRLVELRFYGGLSIKETAEALGVPSQPSSGSGASPAPGSSTACLTRPEPRHS